jgi:hypothetical protein
MSLSVITHHSHNNMQSERTSYPVSNLIPCSEVFEKLTDAELVNNFLTSHRSRIFFFLESGPLLHLLTGSLLCFSKYFDEFCEF